MTYNKDALLGALERIQLSEELRSDFDEMLVVVGKPDPTLEVPDVNNDLTREISFYKSTITAVKYAMSIWGANGVEYHRPMDFYAEMVKTDSHMAKVKKKLLFEQNKIKTAEENKANRLHRKLSKSLLADKQREKAAEKKSTLEAIDQIKGRNDNGDNRKEALDKLLNKLAMKRGEGKQTQIRNGGKLSGKRAQKNSKFGDSRRGSRKNDAESIGDLSGFNRRTGGKNFKKRKVSRPGKESRKQSRK